MCSSAAPIQLCLMQSIAPPHRLAEYEIGTERSEKVEAEALDDLVFRI
jgi:hypothetical protein